MYKTTKLMLDIEAQMKARKIRDLLRFTDSTGFAQVEHEDDARSFIIIRAPDELCENIEKILFK